jgi:hypothetical protein
MTGPGRAHSEVQVRLATPVELHMGQRLVAEHHYLHRAVDARCSPLAYVVAVGSDRWAGVLVFGRLQATRCYPWYGSPADVACGRARLSRWEVLGLARIWLAADVQRGGRCYVPNLATQVVAVALRRIVLDYLLLHPPCFLDEPWQLRECASYCDTSRHNGALYRAANFDLVRVGDAGLVTFSRPLRRLSPSERDLVVRRAQQCARSRSYRSRRAALARQLAFAL